MSSGAGGDKIDFATTQDIERNAPTLSRLTNRRRTASTVQPRVLITEPVELEEGEDREDYELDELDPLDGQDRWAQIHSIWSSAELDQLIEAEELNLETFDVNELRGGYCDALFVRARTIDRADLLLRAERTLPRAFLKGHPLSLVNFLPKQLHELKSVIYRVTRTRAGIKLLKASVAFIVAYTLCLAPWFRAWLGPYSYIMVVSTIINHPGRTVGAQIDGALLTSLGTATGLAWGGFALWLTTIDVFRNFDYAILAVFLCIFMGTLAGLRSRFLRLYQFVICAGLAAIYTCLAKALPRFVTWELLLIYGVPWAFGQAISLATCLVVFPDSGAWGLAVSLNDAFEVMIEGLNVRHHQRKRSRRRLSQVFMNLSQAYRDISLDITVTRFDPGDVLGLRNVLQAVVRSILAIKPEPGLANIRPMTPEESMPRTSGVFQALVQTTMLAAPGLSDVGPGPMLSKIDSKNRAVRVVRYRLGDLTHTLLQQMTEALQSSHAWLMDLSGHRRALGPAAKVKSDISGALVRLRRTMISFDEAETSLLEGEELRNSLIPEVVEMFAYSRPIRQAASSVEAALIKINEMQQRKHGLRIYFPSYPWTKALNRTNAQVRHDRGGVTATAYFKSFVDIRRQIDKIQGKRPAEPGKTDTQVSQAGIARTLTAHTMRSQSAMAPDLYTNALLRKSKLRYRFWKLAHRLQGFEMRFAFKNAVVLSLLAIPAWLKQSQDWWFEYASWWAVAMAWLALHPRVGGNVQDLVTRTLIAALGSIWGGVTFIACQGNRPDIKRLLTIFQRSGLAGCLTFTITSLTLVKKEDDSPSVLVATITISTGLAFVAGIVGAVMINWIIWPFIARHELRKAVSEMIFFLSITYRSIIGRYVYNDHNPDPSPEDVRHSEVLEGRLREGFVRIRQLLVCDDIQSKIVLTRHEIRLRAPFDPLPYSALADCCERFFEYLVAIRQSALFFHPKFVRDNDEAVEKLLCYRRDAVASILTNLYILAGALKANRKVPRYLPSAAAARKRLMNKMAELEAEYDEAEYKLTPQQTEQLKWVQIYQYSYNESLTGCVAQLEELQRYTKLIVGEHGFDAFDDLDFDDDAEREAEQT